MFPSFFVHHRFYLFVLLFFVSLTGIFVFTRPPAQYPKSFSNSVQTEKQTPAISPTLNSSQTFAGLITDINTGCWSDGVCSIKVDDRWIIIEIGGLQSPGSRTTQKGQLIGLVFDKNVDKYLGRQVEVFSGLNSDGHLTLYGDENYFVKLVL